MQGSTPLVQLYDLQSLVVLSAPLPGCEMFTVTAGTVPTFQMLQGGWVEEASARTQEARES